MGVFEGGEYGPEGRDMSVKYDLIVIGAGPAGEKGAAQAAYFGKRVALVERSPVFGGAVASTSIAPVANMPASWLCSVARSV